MSKQISSVELKKLELEIAKEVKKYVMKIILIISLLGELY